MASVPSSPRILMAVFSLALRFQGQEACNAEVKLLLSPAQVHAAVSALKARRETHGRTYFYDTQTLDLLAEGVILRLRESTEIDVTAKLRPLSGEKLLDPSSGRERYKCETDVIDGVENPSFSLQKRYTAAKVPETGPALFQLLSEGQKKLLENSKTQIDWKRIQRVAVIRTTSWTTPANPPLGKLSLERWEWNSGGILEISMKVAHGDEQAAYVELKRLVNENGLGLNTNQRSKTAIALEQITAAHQNNPSR